MSQAVTEPANVPASGEPPVSSWSSFEGDNVSVVFSWVKQAEWRAATTAAEALLPLVLYLPPGLLEAGMTQGVG